MQWLESNEGDNLSTTPPPSDLDSDGLSTIEGPVAAPDAAVVFDSTVAAECAHEIN